MNSIALRDLLIRWCNQNSGSDNLAGLDAMRALLAAEFATLAEQICGVQAPKKRSLLSKKLLPGLPGWFKRSA